MIISIIVILFLAILILDFLPVIKSRKIMLICVYGVLFAASFVILFLKGMNVPLPTIGEPIRYFISTVLKLK